MWQRIEIPRWSPRTRRSAACAADGSREAEEALVRRYSGLVRSCARPLFLAGGDSEDLIQEGMFGLIRAIREYDGAEAASFRTFAEVCIRSRLCSALRAASAREAFAAQPIRSLGYLHSLIANTSLRTALSAGSRGSCSLTEKRLRSLLRQCPQVSYPSSRSKF